MKASRNVRLAFAGLEDLDYLVQKDHLEREVIEEKIGRREFIGDGLLSWLLLALLPACSPAAGVVLLGYLLWSRGEIVVRGEAAFSNHHG